MAETIPCAIAKGQTRDQVVWFAHDMLYGGSPPGACSDLEPAAILFVPAFGEMPKTSVLIRRDVPKGFAVCTIWLSATAPPQR